MGVDCLYLFACLGLVNFTCFGDCYFGYLQLVACGWWFTLCWVFVRWYYWCL